MVRYEEVKEKLNKPTQTMHYINENDAIAINDFDTTLYTLIEDRGISLGIVVLNNDNIVYRILTHNDGKTNNLLNNISYIKQILESINFINSLRIVCCGMNNLDEIEPMINEAFKSFKEDNPNFNVEFNKSWYIIVEANGVINYADKELIEEYYTDNMKKNR